MRFKPSLVLSLGLLSCSLLTNVAQAAPITGEANIAGNVTVTNTNINFNPTFVNTIRGKRNRCVCWSHGRHDTELNGQQCRSSQRSGLRYVYYRRSSAGHL